MLRKKGVSPVIATVMLVGFTVAIIGLVIIWSRGYIEERAQKEEALAGTKLKCEGVRFEVEEAYQTGASLRIKIKNLASQQIDNFVFRIKGDTVETANPERIEKLSALSTATIDLGPSDYDASAVGAIDSVEIIPMLKAGRGKYVPCSGQMMEARVAFLE